MTFKLTATVNHNSFDEPVVHELYYSGNSFGDILDQIDTIPQNIFNLKHYRKTSFKDDNGVRHTWVLKELETE